MRGGRAAIGLGLGLAIAVLTGIVANAVARSNDPIEIPITIHYSHFQPATVTLPVGRPVTFVITNTDPIDHEWIVGDAATHRRAIARLGVLDPLSGWATPVAGAGG